jgi:hypothetical protein
MTRRPYLDNLRTELVCCARQAATFTGYALDDCEITALRFADISAVSAPCWQYAQAAFDKLTEAMDTWDQIAAGDEPYTSAIFPEEGVYAVAWDEDRRALCDEINDYVDRIIFAGIISHLPVVTP